MNSFLKENLITTKDASELSGYTSDYLARLVRSGQITGKRIGHSWTIDSASLEIFLRKQKDKKIDRARDLATSRVYEYREHTKRASSAAETLTTKSSVVNAASSLSELSLAHASLGAHLGALVAAVVVLASGAVLARADALPQAAESIARVAGEAARGFKETFGDIPSRIVARADATREMLRAHGEHDALVAARDAYAAYAEQSFLAKADAPMLQSVLSKDYTAPSRARTGASIVRSDDARASAVSVHDALTNAYAFATTPSRVSSALVHAYVSIGVSGYAAIGASLSAYSDFIQHAGAASLALAAETRDALSATPVLVSRMNLALGESIISAAHGAVRADVSAATSLAAAAPLSAHMTVALLGNAGDALASATSRVPVLAATAFLRATEAPALFAPRIARAIIGTEYAAAERFVAVTIAARGQYRAIIESSGRLAYTGTAEAVSFAGATREGLAALPRGIEDAYLGALGRIASAWEGQTLPDSKGLTFTSNALAAVLAALSPAEQVALATYESLHDLFDSAGNALVAFFSTTPPVVLPEGVLPKSRITAASSTPPAAYRLLTTNTYPTYTTLVQGVSREYVSQSLASLRADILATVAGQIQPVAAQGITNMTTIQQVNMIQDLSNLIVRNGDFRGGTLANGVSVSATTGNFTTLTGGTTSLGATTITGDLIAQGASTLNGALTIPYLTATSTTATSTFAGRILASYAPTQIHTFPAWALGVAGSNPLTASLVINPTTATTDSNLFSVSVADAAKFLIDAEGDVFAGSITSVGGTTLSTTTASTFSVENNTTLGDSINDTTTINGTLIVSGTTTASTVAGNFGVGTTTPNWKLSVAGIGSFDDYVRASYFIATSTTATSTFAGRFAIGTTTPFGDGLFTVGTSSPLLYIANNTGRIGIGTSSPAVAFDLYATDALRVPVGTTVQRPSIGDVGYVRYNTTTHQFEGYGDNSVWQGLGGVINAAQTSYITAGTDDYLRFVTSSAERMTIASGGNVGIGTTSPYAKLSVHANNGDTNTTLFSVASSTASATTTHFVVTNTGDVGIGTGSPNTPDGTNAIESYIGTAVSIYGDNPAISLISNTTISGKNSSIFFGRLGGSSNPYRASIGYDQLSDSLGIYTGGLTAYNSTDARITVLSGGNVGIGATTPNAKLSVKGAGSTTGVNFQTTNSSDSPLFTILDSGSVGVGSTTPWGQLSVNPNGIAGPSFVVGSSTATNFIVTNSGNVGIGTTSPAFKLDVNGIVNATALYVNGTPYIGSQWTTSGSDIYYTTGNIGIGTTTPFASLQVGTTTGKNLVLSDSGAGTDLKHWLFSSLGGSLFIGTTTDAYATSTPSALTITNAGYVGIGTTSPFTKLGVVGTQRIKTTTDSANAFVIENSQATSTFAVSTLDTSDNIFSVASSTGDSYFEITNTGNIGLGVVTPTEKLEVNGAIHIYSATPVSSSMALYNNAGTLTWNGVALATGGSSISGTTNYIPVFTGAATLGNSVLYQSGSSVGIGTTSPAQALSVQGNGYFSGTGFFGGAITSTSTLSIQSTTATSTFSTGGLTIGTNQFVVQQTSGRIGIGTTTPASILDIYGTDAIHLPVGTTAQRPSMALTGQVRYNTTTHQFEGYGDNSVWQGLGGVINAAQTSYITAGTDDFLRFFTSSTERMTLSSAGLLGIGTTTPFASLTIATTTGKNLVLSDSGAGTNLKHWLFSSLGGSLFIGTTTDAYATSSPSALTITNAGYVGIGTTSPIATLSIVGTQRIKTTTNSTSAFVVEDSGGANSLAVSTIGDNSNILSIATSTGVSYFEITSDGYVGIGGVTAPLSLLDVNGGISVGAYAGVNAAPTNGLITSGNIGVGTTSPATLFEVGGSTANVTLGGYKSCTGFTSNANGLVACTASDQRLKQDIVPLDGATALAGLNALNPVSFYWNPATERGTTQQYGLIAQQVQAVFPNLVATSSPTALTPDGTLSVNYEGLISPMVLAIQQIDARTKFITSAASSTVLTVDASGNVGIGTTTPNHTLTVAGDIAAIAFVNTSTREAKTDISYVTASSTETILNQLVNLKVATYRYKIEDQNDPLRLGFIAEEAQAVAPEVLSIDGKGVDLYKLATFTLAGVQALATKVDSQNTRIASLESRIAALESGAVSVSTTSPLSLSTTSLASALQGFGVLIQKGIAQFNTLVFRQLVASKDADGTSSAGSVTIITGNTVAQVANSLVLPSTKVFVTFNASVTGSWWVSDKVVGSFRVVLSAPQTGDVSFDYFLVQTEGQLATSTPSVAGGVTQSSGPDTVAPIITLLGDNPLHVSVDGTFADPGVSAVDAVDGAITPITFVNGIQQTVSSTTITTSSPTTYLITYQATDGAGNMSTATRSVIVGNPDGTVTTGGTGSTATSTPPSSDTTAPVVTLTGAAALQLIIGDVFTDPGATALDNIDGNLTASIVVTGTVDTATTSTATLTYTATDAAGNIGSVSRLVTVVASSTTPI